MATKTTTKKKAAAAAPKKTTTTKTTAAVATKKTMTPASPQKLARVYGYSFASIYALYVTKVERKGRTQDELDEVIGWLTGYRGDAAAGVGEHGRPQKASSPLRR